MKKRFITILILLLIGGIALGIFSFIRKNRQTDTPPIPKNVSTAPLDFQSLQFSETGMSAVRTIIEAERTEDGIRLANVCEYMGNDSREIVREILGDELLLTEVQTKLGALGVRGWDGFIGNNPEGVLDGTSFNFRCTLTDGTTIRASGSNNFPYNYRKAYDYLFTMLYREKIQSTDFHGKYYSVTLPERWVGEVEVTYNSDYNSFLIPLADSSVYLMRIDFTPYAYGETSDAISIGTLVCDETGEKIFLYAKDLKAYMNSNDSTQAQRLIYETYKEDLQTIVESIRPADGYSFVRDFDEK